MARRAGDTAWEIRSSRICRYSGMHEAPPGGAAGTTAPRTRGSGNTALGAEPEAARRREASGIVIQEITQEVKRHRDQPVGYGGRGPGLHTETQHIVAFP